MCIYVHSYIELCVHTELSVFRIHFHFLFQDCGEQDGSGEGGAVHGSCDLIGQMCHMIKVLDLS